MASGGLSSISAGVGHGRACGWSEWLDGEAVQLGVRRIEAGRRAVADAADGGDFARFCSLELGSSCTEEEKGGLGRHQKLRGRPRGEERRSNAMADAWKLAAGHSRRYGVGRHSDEHSGDTVSSFK